MTNALRFIQSVMNHSLHTQRLSKTPDLEVTA